MDSFVEHKHLAPIWANSILNYFLYLSILPTPAFLLASGHRKVDSRKNIGVLVTIKLSYIYKSKQRIIIIKMIIIIICDDDDDYIRSAWLVSLLNADFLGSKM